MMMMIQSIHVHESNRAHVESCLFVCSFVRATAVLAAKRAERHDRTTVHDRPRTIDRARSTAHDRPRTIAHDRPRMTMHDCTRPRTTTYDRPRTISRNRLVVRKRIRSQWSNSTIICICTIAPLHMKIILYIPLFE